MPRAAPLGPCGDGCKRDVLPVHTQSWDARGALATDTALVASSAFHWLPLGPPSLTEVAAELLSLRIHHGGILGKMGRAAVGRVGVSSSPVAAPCRRIHKDQGCCCSVGLPDPSSISKITLHRCRMVPRMPVASLTHLLRPPEYASTNIGVWFVLRIFQCKAPAFPTCWRGCGLISSPGWG